MISFSIGYLINMYFLLLIDDLLGARLSYFLKTVNTGFYGLLCFLDIYLSLFLQYLSG